MGKTTYYWVDDTQGLSLGGCSGHSELDIYFGEKIPDWYQEEFEGKFDEFCANQQISSKKNITFSEKQTASLVNARTTVDKLRVRIAEQTEKIKSLEKKVDDFEASFDELSDLDNGKEEIERLKSDKKYLGECFAALEKEVKVFGDEKAAWEKTKISKKELEKLLKAVK